MQMTCLLSVLDGEAKKAAQTIGTSSIFYATTLKTFKKFRKSFIDITFSSKIFIWQTSYLSNLITLGQFHQELKLTILMPVGCKESVFSSGNLTKSIIHSPYQLRLRFYKFIKEINLIDGSINLVTFEKFLEDQLENFCNLLADMIVEKNDMLKNRYQIAKLINRQSIHSLETDININSVNYVSQESKEEDIIK